MTWRIDAREQFSPNRVKGTLSATPDRTYVNGTAGSFAVVIGTNPTVQIGPIATTPGSLSQSVREFVIFEGGGVERQFGLSTGLSWRF